MLAPRMIYRPDWGIYVVWHNMKIGWRLALASIALLAIWLLLDFSYVRAGQPPGATDTFDYIFFASGYMAFLWACWPLFESHSRFARGSLRMFSAALLFLLWLIPFMIFVLQFHVAIGGTL